MTDSTGGVEAGQATGVELIAAERERQVTQEGWTPEHDKQHDHGELAMAAVCYASPRRVFVQRQGLNAVVFADPWPFPPHSDISGRGYYDWDKRKSGNIVQSMPEQGANRIAFLVKAGALIAAEIDRLKRVSS